MLEQLGATEVETSRLVEYRARVGQHRFAHDVIQNCHYTCVFCGLRADGLPGQRLLIASHIKPWAKSDSLERLDARNGVAACPTHDAAFDTGLLTINGGLRIHRARRLEEEAEVNESVGRFFRPPLLLDRATFPAGSLTPKKRYLDYHRAEVFLAG